MDDDFHGFLKTSPSPTGSKKKKSKKSKRRTPRKKTKSEKDEDTREEDEEPPEPSQPASAQEGGVQAEAEAALSKAAARGVSPHVTALGGESADGSADLVEGSQHSGHSKKVPPFGQTAACVLLE